MKLRIAESKPGELVSRAVEAVRVIERLTGRTLLRDDLCKASPAPSKTPQFEYQVLDESVDRAGAEVERIRKLMVKRINEVLK